MWTILTVKTLKNLQNSCLTYTQHMDLRVESVKNNLVCQTEKKSVVSETHRYDRQDVIWNLGDITHYIQGLWAYKATLEFSYPKQCLKQHPWQSWSHKTVFYWSAEKIYWWSMNIPPSTGAWTPACEHKEQSQKVSMNMLPVVVILLWHTFWLLNMINRYEAMVISSQCTSTYISILR